MRRTEFNIDTLPEHLAVFNKVKAAIEQLPETLATGSVDQKCQCGAKLNRLHDSFCPTSQMLALSICEHFGLAFQEGVIDTSVRAWCVFPDSSLILLIHPAVNRLAEVVLVDTERPQHKGLYKVKYISRKDHLGGLSEEVFAERLAATMHVFSLFKNPGIEVRI